MTDAQLAKAFLDYCIEQEVIPSSKANQARLIAERSERDIYDVLLDLHLVSLRDLSRILEQVSGHPFIDPLYESLKRPFSKDVLVKLSHKVAFQHMAFPLKIEDGELHMVMANPTRDDIVATIERMAGYPIKRYVGYAKNVLRAVVRFYSDLASRSYETLVNAALDEVAGVKNVETPPNIWTEPIGDALKREIRLFPQLSQQPPEDEIAVSLLVQKIIDNGIFLGVSDIHIEPFADVIKVRFRKDGQLFAQWYLPKALQTHFFNRLKVLAGVNPTMSNKPQGGNISYETVAIVGVDIRASFVPTMYGDRIVLRLLDKSRTLLDPMDLGMHDEHLDIFHRHIRATQGLVLMTGPTGSGKTTSIYAALDQLNEVHRSIITIEDPIEYRMVGVSQIQVSEVRQMGFAEIFREVLRQDPNVVLLGEVRDADSAQVAVTAASTGHLVFTTLHTNNAAAAIPRLLMMGADPVVLSDAVHLIIAQRLVRRLCPECKQPDPLPDERLTKLGLKRDDLGDHQFYVAGPGCERCNETRHAGRIGVFEFLVPDDEIRQMIIERTPALSIERHARELGMRLMADDALQKARDGVISLDEYVHVPGAI